MVVIVLRETASMEEPPVYKFSFKHKRKWNEKIFFLNTKCSICMHKITKEGRKEGSEGGRGRVMEGNLTKYIKIQLSKVLELIRFYKNMLYLHNRRGGSPFLNL